MKYENKNNNYVDDVYGIIVMDVDYWDNEKNKSLDFPAM